MIYVITIAIYLIGLVIIGFFKAKQIKTQSDFSVAGRALTPWVLVGTMLATWMGTGSILGNAGKTYQSGMAGLWLPLGSVLGIIILTQIAGKVRSYNKFTVPEIIGERYGQVARLLSVIALVLAYMVIVSYQYNAGGAVLHTIFIDDSGVSAISVETGTIIAAVFFVIAGVGGEIALQGESGGILIGFCSLLAIVNILLYIFKKEMYIGFETAGGDKHQLVFKQAVIEGIPVNIERVESVIEMVNDLISEAASGKSVNRSIPTSMLSAGGTVQVAQQAPLPATVPLPAARPAPAPVPTNSLPQLPLTPLSLSSTLGSRPAPRRMPTSCSAFPSLAPTRAC